MASFNKVILMGNLTRDVEVKYLQSGAVVGRIGIAVNRVWYDKSTNEKREEVTFVDVDVFGRSAENAAQYLSKGSSVHIEGRLKLDQWDDKQSGQKRQKLKVVCERMQFVGGKRREGQQQQQRPQQNGQRQQPQRQQQAQQPAGAAVQADGNDGWTDNLDDGAGPGEESIPF